MELKASSVNRLMMGEDQPLIVWIIPGQINTKRIIGFSSTTVLPVPSQQLPKGPPLRTEPSLNTIGSHPLTIDMRRQNHLMPRKGRKIPLGKTG